MSVGTYNYYYVMFKKIINIYIADDEFNDTYSIKQVQEKRTFIFLDRGKL